MFNREVRGTQHLFVVACEREVGAEVAPLLGLRRMSGVIKDVDLCIGPLGCDDRWVEGHVTGTVHLPLVQDLLHNLDLGLFRISISGFTRVGG